MKELAYYPAGRILAVIENAECVGTCYCGNIAEHEFVKALGTDVPISIVDGSFKMRLRPANIEEFIAAHGA